MGMELIAIVSATIIFTVGFLMGKTTQGININITHKEAEKETPTIKEPTKEYNQSTINELPEEIRHYYEKNNGFIE